MSKLELGQAVAILLAPEHSTPLGHTSCSSLDPRRTPALGTLSMIRAETQIVLGTCICTRLCTHVFLLCSKLVLKS